ncbi:MAG TPA: hypothetical protein VFV08_12270, partial [Puia sp.]|nr:hypothetical protein [Puia sp.]
MLAHAGRKGQFNRIMILIVISVLVEQFVIAKIIPWSSRLLGINPIPVILGVPVNLAINVGLLPIIISFFSCFFILSMMNDTLQKKGSREFWKG